MLNISYNEYKIYNEYFSEKNAYSKLHFCKYRKKALKHFTFSNTKDQFFYDKIKIF